MNTKYLGLIVLLWIGKAWTNPAVSELNGKTEGFAGNINGSATENLAGSITAPVGESLGLQLDLLEGDIGPEQLHGTGTHVFWRDSQQGLAGLTLSHVELGQFEGTRYGFEGEYYQKQWTLSGQLGHQTGDIDDSNYINAALSWYPWQEAVMTLADTTADGINIISLETEYQFMPHVVPGLSIFVQAGNGDQEHDHLLIGIRYYIGSDKSLIQRHREDDPINNLFANTVGMHQELHKVEVFKIKHFFDSGDDVIACPAAEGFIC